MNKKTAKKMDLLRTANGMYLNLRYYKPRRRNQSKVSLVRFSNSFARKMKTSLFV